MSTDTTHTATTSRVDMAPGFAPNPVITAGDGAPPVVFLHDYSGHQWTPFLDDLAARSKVVAPCNPGAEDPLDLRSLDNLHDLVLYYDQLFDELGLGPVALVGHGYGGMVAAEYAATYTRRVSRLVLMGAMGLWLEEQPVNDFLTVDPHVLAAQVWNDPDRPEVVASMKLPEDLAEAQEHTVRTATAIASVAHFAYPIPEHGLAKRLSRICAPTLLLWGAEDGLVPPVYADEFASRLSDSQIVLVPDAAHNPHIEARETTSRAVLDFLDKEAVSW